MAATAIEKMEEECERRQGKLEEGKRSISWAASVYQELLYNSEQFGA
jgi:hypothetical protein